MVKLLIFGYLNQETAKQLRNSLEKQCVQYITAIQESLHDKYAATIATIKNEIKNERLHFKKTYHSSKYMNNIIEQDHRHIKRITNHMLGFKHF